MTQEEAERAAATFEFPPFRAEVLRTWVFFDWDDPLAHGYNIWELLVFRGKETVRSFETPQEWLDYYAQWKVTQARCGGDGDANGFEHSAGRGCLPRGARRKCFVAPVTPRS